MDAAAQRLEFAPPPGTGSVRALGLAILVHACLLAALTWGVHWRREAQSLQVEAELWSALPVQAAPPPAPPPAPAPDPAATPEPLVQGPSESAIALEREKFKRQKDEERTKALERQRQERLKQEALRRENERRRAEEALRQENLQRMAGLASKGGTGSASEASGPSASYAARLRARIKPNIVFADEVVGNPNAEVEVRTAPNGTIISRTLIKSSGSRSWDEAVLKAIDKTGELPRDVDGRVPARLVISFRPKD